MKCTESICQLNCCGYCQNVSSILDEITFGPIPEPDGCPDEKTKLSQSEE
ncbi:MAG: hypothetical protein J6I68_08300 [Butyrivibrio sp.]|nr:hypothetical protein [Butyrivibrio sp.]MBP3783231.1 hypothetical protein [Butyrivibrio sp.]